MGWFSDLFSSTKDSRNSRTAMFSTHEAFSLPTSSPDASHHPDAFNPESLNLQDPQSAASYSYPPQSPSGAYDYVPASSGSRSRQSTVLPLHGSPTTPSSAPYPPLLHTWNRLRSWLSNEYPELGDTLNYGILPQDLAQIEMAFGFALPSAIRESYLCVDGQEAESVAGCSEGLFFGLTLLPLEDVLEEWRFWREVDDDPNTGANPRLRETMQSIPPNWIRKEYSSRGWIPLVADKAGNYLGVDLHPGENGSVGQVIVFGRDFDTKVVMWRGDGPGGWGKFLASFAEELESGEGYEMGNQEASEGSEDSIGYENYFFDGVGRGLGDGGGDAGTGGMRLSGEYKGWNVLEAWADRSVRRWQEAGVVPETPAENPDKGKTREKIRPALLDLNDKGAEVAIPVLAEVGEPAPPTRPISNGISRGSVSSRQPIPIISVTKPPLPLPVGLPTQDDIFVPLTSADDLEAAVDAMPEVEKPLPAVQISPALPSPPPPQHAKSTSVAQIVPSPPAPVTRTLTSSPEPILPPPSSEVPDLLVDATPALPAAPIVPQTIVASGPLPEDDAQVVEAPAIKPDEESPVLVQAEDVPEASADTTIRLVSGGGISGIVEEPLSSEGVLVPQPEPEPVAEIAPAPASDAPPKKEGRHEKKKSISSNLKKLGNLGGKRKKDSVSSLKEVV